MNAMERIEEFLKLNRSELMIRFNPVRREWTARLEWGVVPPCSNVGNLVGAHGSDLDATLSVLLSRAEGN